MSSLDYFKTKILGLSSIDTKKSNTITSTNTYKPYKAEEEIKYLTSSKKTYIEETTFHQTPIKPFVPLLKIPNASQNLALAVNSLKTMEYTNTNTNTNETIKRENEMKTPPRNLVIGKHYTKPCFSTGKKEIIQ